DRVERRHLRRPPRGVPRRRSPLRPRPQLPLPDGAERLPGRVRALGAGHGADDDRHRGRVPAQGAHVRALLADPVPRAHVRAAPPGAGVLGRDRVSPPAALLERAAAPAAAGHERRAGATRHRLRGRPGGPAGRPRARRALDAPARTRPRAPDPALLPAGDARDRDRARRLPAPRRARDVGQGRRLTNHLTSSRYTSSVRSATAAQLSGPAAAAALRSRRAARRSPSPSTRVRAAARPAASPGCTSSPTPSRRWSSPNPPTSLMTRGAANASAAASTPELSIRR